MKVTDRTRLTLSYRRTVRQWIKDGFEQVGESGGRIWEIYRGGRVGKRIVDVRIAPDGRSIFVKVS